MRGSSSSRFVITVALVGLAWLALPAPAPPAQALKPIAYVVKVLAPETHTADVTATIPSDGRASIDLFMATWSPGFYRVENYASRVQELTARRPDGRPLPVEQPAPNRWRVRTHGAPAVVVSYRLICNERSVTTNSVSSDLVVLNGAATFLTLAERARRPHDVRLELSPMVPRAMTALDAASGRARNSFRAADFDELVDSPIVAGDLDVREFAVEGSQHALVDAGPRDQWDGQRAASDLQRMVRAVRRFWGFLPYRRYVFLNVFRQGGGGLEHKNSTLLTVNAARVATPEGYRSWLAFAGHEYFHAFNVKRLRPAELGPFDYEKEPRTTSLWLSEGVTSYYAALMLSRAGLTAPPDFLASMSSVIRQLQQAPGRLVQTLEQSSYDVWNNSLSGVNPNATTVSYYVKGEVVGLLLDAHIRQMTGGSRSLDDVMRLAYERYAGDRGFTPDEFRATAEEVARIDLRDWFRRALASTEELDYAEALSWYGLRFAASSAQDPKAAWTLEARDDASDAQKTQLRALLGGDS